MTAPAGQQGGELNLVERLVAEEFSGPGLWSVPEYPRAEPRTEVPSQYYMAPWVSLLYGARIVPGTGDEAGEGGVVEVTSLDTMFAIQAVVAERILTGEGARPSKIVESPEPHLYVYSAKNNDLWLREFGAGHWPIMTTTNFVEGGPVTLSAHDRQAAHIFNSLAQPREVQGLATTAAYLELGWRALHFAGVVPDKMLFKPGEKEDDDDPWRNRIESAPCHTPGIFKLDNLTALRNYADLLGYAVQGPGNSALERLKEVAAQDSDNEPTPLPVDRRYFAVEALKRMRWALLDVANFVSLHQTGENLTQGQADEIMAGYIVGVARVADKLMGIWEEPTAG
ncbi:MAG TPA: hypothetical protein VLF40_01350 [Candidatus Saccharimonadales bacterium]|nr:hypothetical protein [Candidatus Saccharimonadales bacterium]